MDGLERAFNSLLMCDGWEEGEVHWQIAKGGQLVLGVQSPKGRPSYDYRTRPVFPPERLAQWVQLAVVFDRSTRRVSHFIDGEEISSEAMRPDSEHSIRLDYAEIGNWNYAKRLDRSPVRNLNGRLDELLIFDRALNAAEVQHLSRSGQPGLETPMKHSLPVLLVAAAFAASTALAAEKQPESADAPAPPVEPRTPAEALKTFNFRPAIGSKPCSPSRRSRTGSTSPSTATAACSWSRCGVTCKTSTAPAGTVSRVSLHWSSKGDGVFDKHTVFADKLMLPRIFLPLDKGRAIIGETDTNDLYLYTDSDGDGVSDKKDLFYQGGPRGGNMEHQPHGLVWSMDNWLYSTYNSYRLRWTPQGTALKDSTAPNGGQWGVSQDDYGKVWFVNGGGEKCGR